ncbi:hypothetical protein LpeD_23 [Lactobacillus phage LpeD]|uniref:Uncharacterized protein n=1 Tax=Lactobacillus phage LpeD TaxID=2041210 RepID=A0A291I9G7_9CAUD|nr:hypothetical protein HWB32_gp022 [Lactobacillus phage LpeD]ATG86332.1 hypothetical protein LpeD_23 [Lactobacillus phage LpeD]
MKFKIKNKYLKDSIELLTDAPLTGMQSIARTRLIKVLKEPFKDYAEEEKELIDSVVKKDENGKPVKVENGLKISEGKEDLYLDSLNKIENQIAEIDKPTYTGHLSEVKDILKEYSQPLTGTRAEAYMALCEALNVFDE